MAPLIMAGYETYNNLFQDKDVAQEILKSRSSVLVQVKKKLLIKGMLICSEGVERITSPLRKTSTEEVSIAFQSGNVLPE